MNFSMCRAFPIALAVPDDTHGDDSDSGESEQGGEPGRDAAVRMIVGTDVIDGLRRRRRRHGLRRCLWLHVLGCW